MTGREAKVLLASGVWLVLLDIGAVWSSFSIAVPTRLDSSRPVPGGKMALTESQPPLEGGRNSRPIAEKREFARNEPACIPREPRFCC
jgi:hypothetical protein